MREQRIGNPHSGWMRLTHKHGAEASAVGNLVVDRHLSEFVLERLLRQPIRPGHVDGCADHDIALSGDTGADCGTVDCSKVADQLATVLELAAHEHAVVRNEHVVKKQKRLGDVAGLRGIPALFLVASIARTAGFDNRQPFCIAGNSRRDTEILFGLTVATARNNNDFVTGRDTANLNLVAANHDPIRTHFLDVQVSVLIRLRRGLL